MSILRHPRWPLLLALIAPLSARADSPDGYAMLDPRATVRVLATVPGESLAQVVADPAGRLWLGGREGVFVVEPGDVKPGLKLTEVYREPGDHWFMGLAVRGDDLYVAKHDAIMILPGAVKGRGPIAPKPIVWGFPRAKGWAFHQTLHDIKFGPDGKLYFSMGDLAWNFGGFQRPDHWFQTRIETAGTPARRDVVSVGGIFRCDPADGSNLELVATGTRNNCGFDWNAAFDLFTTDNDHEQDDRYVPSRLLFVVDGGYYNWPRGWMGDRPEDLPAVAGMGREVPVGLAVYGDRRFPDDYQGNVLVARWGQRKIDRFALAPEGSGYKGKEIPWLTCPPGRRPLAVAVGRGGRVYALVSHMETNAESPTYTADLLEIDAVGTPEGFQGYDPVAVPVDRLWEELSRPDLSRRNAAHQELARRGGDAFDGLDSRIASSKENDPGRSHLIQLAGIVQPIQSIESLRVYLRAIESLRRLLVDPVGADARYQAILAETEFRSKAWPLLIDRSARIRRATLSGLLLAKEIPSGALRLAASRVGSEDPYERQLAARLLAQGRSQPKPNPDRPGPNAKGNPPVPPKPIDPRPTRDNGLGSVLADGFFLTIPPTYDPLPKVLKLATSSYEVPPADGRHRIGLFTTADWWKALDKTPAHEAAFGRLVAAIEDADPVVRLQALRSLTRLGDPRIVLALERLVDANHADPATDLALSTLAWLGGSGEWERIAKVLKSSQGSTRRAAAEALMTLDVPSSTKSELVAEAIDTVVAMDGLNITSRQAAVRRLANPGRLRSLTLDAKADPQLRAAALEKLAVVADALVLGEVLARIEPAAGSRVLGPAARLAVAKLEPATALRRLGAWLESPSEAARLAAAQAIAASGTTETRALARSRLAAEASPSVLMPLAESVLAGPDDDGRDAALASLLRSRTDLDPDLKTRLIDHLRKRPEYAGIADQVGRPADPADIPPAFAIDWSKAWKQGDPARGKALFLAKEGVSCVACHKFRGEGGQNGPSLDEADQRLSVPYMAESVIKPNAQVAPQYRPWTIALTSGEVLTGILLQEGADSLTVGLNDGTTRVIPKADVEERKQATTSIMPEKLVKTPEDLRDILAYLLTP